MPRRQVNAGTWSRRSSGLPAKAISASSAIGGLVSDFCPESGGWPWALAGSAVRFGVAYVPVRLLEWRRIYLRL